jgi:hypothetical protein
MATIVIDISTTVTSSFTASTLPASQAGGSSRTMAATDQGITNLKSEVNRLIQDLFAGVGISPPQVVTTVTVT